MFWSSAVEGERVWTRLVETKRSRCPFIWLSFISPRFSSTALKFFCQETIESKQETLTCSAHGRGEDGDPVPCVFLEPPIALAWSAAGVVAVECRGRLVWGRGRGVQLCRFPRRARSQTPNDESEQLSCLRRSQRWKIGSRPPHVFPQCTSAVTGVHVIPVRRLPASSKCFHFRPNECQNSRNQQN